MLEIRKFVGTLIWEFCETFDISLGKSAPKILGMMIGCNNFKETKKEKK